MINLDGFENPLKKDPLSFSNSQCYSIQQQHNIITAKFNDTYLLK